MTFAADIDDVYSVVAAVADIAAADIVAVADIVDTAVVDIAAAVVDIAAAVVGIAAAVVDIAAAVVGIVAVDFFDYIGCADDFQREGFATDFDWYTANELAGHLDYYDWLATDEEYED